MSFDLSFSEEFFSGTDYPEDIELSDKPTSVLQAILSLPKRELVQIARDVLHLEWPVFSVMTESFPHLVLDKVRETDTCRDLSSPVEVYIDAEGYHSVLVYDSERG